MKVERLGNSGDEEQVFDFGIGTILEFFQSEGNIPVEREDLKIRGKGSKILGPVLWSVIEEILSGPEAVSIGIKK